METNNKLTENEIERYSRQIRLQEVEFAGQEKLKNAKVLIMGAGGLGSAASIYLAAAGIGTIGIADYDRVEHSNLQRQILHSTETLGTLKTESALKNLRRLNPLIKINLHNERLGSENIIKTITDYDVVVDGTDNLPVRYLINDACIEQKKPLVYGSVLRFEGQVSVFKNGGPCLRCLLSSLPIDSDSCEQEGILGAVAGIIGTIQAIEALKTILGIGNVLSGKLLAFNALTMRFTEFKINKKNKCVCG